MAECRGRHSTPNAVLASQPRAEHEHLVGEANLKPQKYPRQPTRSRPPLQGPQPWSFSAAATVAGRSQLSDQQIERDKTPGTPAPRMPVLAVVVVVPEGPPIWVLNEPLWKPWALYRFPLAAVGPVGPRWPGAFRDHLDLLDPLDSVISKRIRAMCPLSAPPPPVTADTPPFGLGDPGGITEASGLPKKCL